MIQCLYSLWETERVQQLNERDYTTLAYELALRIRQVPHGVFPHPDYMPCIHPPHG